MEGEGNRKRASVNVVTISSFRGNHLILQTNGIEQILVSGYSFVGLLKYLIVCIYLFTNNELVYLNMYMCVVYVHMCVCLHVWVHMCMCTCVLMKGPEVDEGYLLPSMSAVVASISSELTDLVSLSSQFAQGILPLPPRT